MWNQAFNPLYSEESFIRLKLYLALAGTRKTKNHESFQLKKRRDPRKRKQEDKEAWLTSHKDPSNTHARDGNLSPTSVSMNPT